MAKKMRGILLVAPTAFTTQYMLSPQGLARLNQILTKMIYLLLLLLCYAAQSNAADINQIQADGIKDMLSEGQTMIGVAAKWGGILTVVLGAIALGSGKLEGALAQTIAKILIVVGLLASAIQFFGGKINGFTF